MWVPFYFGCSLTIVQSISTAVFRFIDHLSRFTSPPSSTLNVSVVALSFTENSTILSVAEVARSEHFYKLKGV